MARLYADEQFPQSVSEQLQTMGHDVLTVQDAGNANLDIPDEAVLAFAIHDSRAVVTPHYELVDGELIPMSLGTGKHGVTRNRTKLIGIDFALTIF